MLSKKAVQHFLRSMRDAIRSNHRRVIVLTGNDDSKLVESAMQLIEEYLKHYGTGNKKIAYVYHAFYEDGVRRKEIFSESFKLDKVAFIPYHEVRKILGLTYDIAVLDLINNLEPNDIGRLSGVVSGGGFYIFIMARLSDYEKIITRFQRTLLTPQYKFESIRHIFVRRFIKKLFEHNGIAIYDVDKRKFLKKFRLRRKTYKIVEYTGKPFEIPLKSRFPKIAYELALTKDQVEVLKILEGLYERPGKGEKVAIIVTADRGRGKSSVIGIGLGALAHKLKKAKGVSRIIVTAPNEYNVQPLFMLARKTLEKLGYEVNVFERDNVILALRAKGIDIEYFNPLEASRRKADIVAVDEAAGLQVPMLFTIINKFDRVIFSSTIHGYEGAGRGFSIRFLGRLKRMENVRIFEYEMEQPIRYAGDDPIEKWIFDTLLLDAEPAPLDDKEMEYIEKLDVEYYIPQLEKFFLEQEDELRQFIGIYIAAHYRNNPNDLGMMMDAPHHVIRALKIPTGKIVASLELAEEGPLRDELAKESARGAWILGNIIPDRIIKHYKIVDFGDFIGWRIVRIAVHPHVMGRGLGSKLLSELENEARERGYDWVGAGFGVTSELLNFWVKNGYTPIHISPDRNPVSGEYTVLVVKPLNEKVSVYIKYVAMEFKRKLLDMLYEPYHDLEPEIALMLLKATPDIENLDLKLTPSQTGRFMSYAWSDLTLESCMDCMVAVTKFYFGSKNKPQLSKTQELMLIVRVLQGKSWRMSCDELKLEPPYFMQEIKKIAKIFSKYYFNVESLSEAEKFFFLKLDDLIRNY